MHKHNGEGLGIILSKQMYISTSDTDEEAIKGTDN